MQKENRNVWTREQEEELSSLYEQFKNETGTLHVQCIIVIIIYPF